MTDCCPLPGESSALCSKELQLGGTANARDIWRHEAVPFRDGQYRTTLESHAVLLIRFSTAT